VLTEFSFPSIIAEATRLHGDLTFFSSAQVFGVIEGSVSHQTSERLHIGRTGWIHGEINSQGPVIIEGKVEGNIRSDSRIVLNATAVVRGALEAPSICVRPGAILDGTLDIASKSNPIQAEIPKAA